MLNILHSAKTQTQVFPKFEMPNFPFLAIFFARLYLQDPVSLCLWIFCLWVIF